MITQQAKLRALPGEIVHRTEKSLPAAQTVPMDIDATGIPQYGREETAREDHV
jgi:hypothetical protein